MNVSDRFCPRCGWDSLPARDHRQAGDAEYVHTLKILNKEEHGSIFYLEKPVTIIGRKNADIVIRDSKISSKHAGIDIKEGIASVKDLGSSNGTFHNGRKIEEARLSDGDKLRLGETILEYNKKEQEIPLMDDVATIRDEDKEEAGPVEPGPVNLLEIITGPDQGNVIALKNPLSIIGRKGADININDPKISARHASIEILEDNITLRDLESINGVFLDDVRVTQARISPGDRVKIGDTELVFKIAQETLKSRGPDIDNTIRDNALAKKSCPECGGQIEPEDRFCVKCGHPVQEEVMEEKQETEEERDETRLKNQVSMHTLLVVSGEDKGKCFAVKSSPFTIGRKDSDIVINDPMVSGSHAVIELIKGKALLKDTESANGVFVNDRPVLEAVLQPGDLIIMGSTTLKYGQPQGDEEATIEHEYAPAEAGTRKPAQNEFRDKPEIKEEIIIEPVPPREIQKPAIEKPPAKKPKAVKKKKNTGCWILFFIILLALLFTMGVVWIKMKDMPVRLLGGMLSPVRCASKEHGLLCPAGEPAELACKNHAKPENKPVTC